TLTDEELETCKKIADFIEDTKPIQDRNFDASNENLLNIDQLIKHQPLENNNKKISQVAQDTYSRFHPEQRKSDSFFETSPDSSIFPLEMVDSILKECTADNPDIHQVSKLFYFSKNRNTLDFWKNIAHLLGWTHLNEKIDYF